MQKSFAFEISSRHSRYVEDRQIGWIEAAQGGEIGLLLLTKPVIDSNSFALTSTATSTCWFHSWNAMISQASPQIRRTSRWNTRWNSFQKWSRVDQSHRDMFNCLFLKMAIETNNLEAVNMMFYQSDSKCSQVGAQARDIYSFIHIHIKRLKFLYRLFPTEVEIKCKS